MEILFLVEKEQMEMSFLIEKEQMEMLFCEEKESGAEWICIVRKKALPLQSENKHTLYVHYRHCGRHRLG